MNSAFIKNSNFLGILEGKRKARIEEEKRKTKELEAQLFLETSGARQQELSLSQQEIAMQNDAKIKTTLIVAVIVIVVMSGLFFIVKS